MSINDVTNSNDSGMNGFVFTVTLSAPNAEDVTVDYTTVNGPPGGTGAIAGSQPIAAGQPITGSPTTTPGDYHAESGT